MYAKHRTKNGEQLYISQMDDNHLKNTVKLMLKNINDAKKLANQEVPMSKFQKAMYKTESTTFLHKIDQIDKIRDVIMRELGQKFGVEDIPFPDDLDVAPLK